MKKSQKFQLQAKFSGPPSPLFEKGTYPQKRHYFLPNGNYKVLLLQNFNPPYFIMKPNLTDFFIWGVPLVSIPHHNFVTGKFILVWHWYWLGATLLFQFSIQFPVSLVSFQMSQLPSKCNNYQISDGEPPKKFPPLLRFLGGVSHKKKFPLFKFLWGPPNKKLTLFKVLGGGPEKKNYTFRFSSHEYPFSFHLSFHVTITLKISQLPSKCQDYPQNVTITLQMSQSPSKCQDYPPNVTFTLKMSRLPSKCHDNPQNNTITLKMSKLP